MGLKQILKDAGADLLKKAIVWVAGLLLAPYLLTFVPKIGPILLANIRVPVWALLSAIGLLALGGIVCLGNWLGRRKPRLYVHPALGQSVWCVVPEGESRESMQVIFAANLNHDDEKLTLVITDAYPVGTQPQVSTMETDRLRIPPTTIVPARICVFVLPLKARRGQPLITKFVLVDQFRRKHKTPKITFKWVG